jgi:hypothetical protein
MGISVETSLQKAPEVYNKHHKEQHTKLTEERIKVLITVVVHVRYDGREFNAHKK